MYYQSLMDPNLPPYPDGLNKLLTDWPDPPPPQSYPAVVAAVLRLTMKNGENKPSFTNILKNFSFIFQSVSILYPKPPEPQLHN